MTLFQFGNEHGVKGGEALLAKYGRQHYVEMGRKGGRVSRRRALTDEQVRTIRALVASGERQYVVADDFGVSHATVYEIVRGISYQDVAE